MLRGYGFYVDLLFTRLDRYCFCFGWTTKFWWTVLFWLFHHLFCWSTLWGGTTNPISRRENLRLTYDSHPMANSCRVQKWKLLGVGRSRVVHSFQQLISVIRIKCMSFPSGFWLLKYIMYRSLKWHNPVSVSRNPGEMLAPECQQGTTAPLVALAAILDPQNPRLPPSSLLVCLFAFVVAFMMPYPVSQLSKNEFKGPGNGSAHKTLATNMYIKTWVWSQPPFVK